MTTPDMTPAARFAAGWLALGIRVSRLDDVHANRLCVITGTTGLIDAGFALSAMPASRAEALLSIAEAQPDDEQVTLGQAATAATRIAGLSAADRALLRKVTRAVSTTANDLIPALAQLGPRALVGAAKLAQPTRAFDDTPEADSDQAGSAIERGRTAAGLSQEDLAAAIGVTPQTVRNWEHGVSLPRVVAAEALITCLQLDDGDAQLLLQPATTGHRLTHGSRLDAFRPG